MAKTTASRKGEVTEGLGALVVIVIGLVGIPLVLALVVGWPLPHHVPNATQLHSAAASQIPEDFWPKALAVLAWVAWAFFVFSLALGTIDVIRFRRRGTWRRAAGKSSMAALVTAVIVLATIRGSVTPHRLIPAPAAVALVDVSHTAATFASPARPASTTYTVAVGDSLYGVALAHYGDGEQWRTIYAANVGVRQGDGRALDATNWIYPGWKLILPNQPTPAVPPVAELLTTEIPTTTPSETAPAVTHIVTAGENLWDIALAYYGDGEQWHTIYAANEGVAQPDGLVLSDPSLIYPGWELSIPPAAATPSTPATSSSTPAPSSAPPPTAPASSTPPSSTSTIPPTTIPHPAHLPSPSARGQTERHSPTSSRHAGPPNLSRSPTSTGSLHRVQAEPTHSHPFPGRETHGGNRELPAVAIGGLGLLAAAVLARSLRRRRRIARVGLRPGDVIAASSASIRDLESALAALVDSPTVDWLELTLSHLTQVSEQRNRPVPAIRLLRVGTDGVDLFLTEAAGIPPGAFEVAEDGWVWTLPTTTPLDQLVGTSECAPWFPILVPIGEDEQGQTYLAPIQPGTVVPLRGPGANEVLAAMATTAANWSWGQQIMVTNDPADATAASSKYTSDSGGLGDRVLYLGSPMDLSSETKFAVSILTTADVAGTDLELRCLTNDTIEIMPMQLRLRACRLNPEASAGITEAMTTAGTPPGTGHLDHQITVGEVVEGGSGASPNDDDAVALPLTQPELEVRLLTNTPSITGLCQTRITGEGRHFELLALIALSGGLSKEEARAAMYGPGSSTGNVANLASQARKMLGLDSAGQPFLPEASQKGILALSAAVTNDLGRLCDAVSATATMEPSGAIDLCAAALDLIEVTPGSTIDHSWNWWIHYAAIAERAALGAACTLARLTIATKGDLDIARHGIDQARALAPFAEELYRVAIELAGAAGNLGWAQREWDDLRRMLSDLSPGAAPSLETEAIYRAAMQANMGEDITPRRSLPLAAGFH